MAELIADFPLLSCNTFGFDVRARYGCLLESLDDLTQVLAEPRLAGLPRLVLGGGSNVVLRGDFDGVVWLMRLRGRRLLREDDDAYYVEAAAGENWHELVAWTLQQGWPGLENLALIPGTVGAAPIQNIGAYGLELADRCASVSAFDLERGERVEFDATACRFGYRDSFFKQQGRDRYVIVSVTLRLPKPWRSCADYADVRRELGERGITSPKAQDIFDAVVVIRRAKLPDPAQIGNAGSFFKNPVVSAPTAAALAEREPQLVSYAQPDGRVKLAAGWLIDQCGWKGQTLGPAGVHPRQALVLINHGGATGADVLTLAQQIRDSVRARFGVELEAEPVVI